MQLTMQLGASCMPPAPTSLHATAPNSTQVTRPFLHAPRPPVHSGCAKPITFRQPAPFPWHPSLLSTPQDHPLAIGEGQTISAPHMHAICMELLEHHLQPGARVLDVGAGESLFREGGLEGGEVYILFREGG